MVCMHVSNPGTYGEAARAYLASVINNLLVSEDFVHVAAVDFAGSANIRYYLNQYYNRDDIFRATTQIQITGVSTAYCGKH